MATPTKNFPTGSYRSYKSFLSKYSSNQPSKAHPLEQAVNKKDESVTNCNESCKGEPCNSNLPNEMIDINALLAMTNQEIELIDKEVLKQFLLLLSEHQTKRIDINNNLEHRKVTDCNRVSALSNADIEGNKQSLIESLKRQLERYRHD